MPFLCLICDFASLVWCFDVVSVWVVGCCVLVDCLCLYGFSGCAVVALVLLVFPLSWCGWLLVLCGLFVMGIV